MTLEETIQLYASVLRQLLPAGGYDPSPDTEVLAVDIYAHAKVLAQADIDAHRLLQVLETIPVDLLADYEREYGLPMQCVVPGTQSVEERINVLRWIRASRNVLNYEYLKLLLAIFDVELLELRKYVPIRCTSPCDSPINTEQLRYKVRIVIPDTSPADLSCIIENYLPAYLRVDVLKVAMLFKTSLPYPIYFTEQLVAGLSLGDSASRPDPELISVKIPAIESVGAVLTLHDVIVTHPPKLELTEKLSTQLNVNNVISRQLLKFSLDESIEVSLSVHDVVSKPRIKTNVDEAISVSLLINDVIREKI